MTVVRTPGYFVACLGDRKVCQVLSWGIEEGYFVVLGCCFVCSEAKAPWSTRSVIVVREEMS